ncbi:MAG: RluA family pseudouridine synthase [Firmicutes bacterium]|nr:RluA family pseudouridine synthase [Bacillota bacterium]
MVNITITENEAGQRLDRFLKKYLKRAPLSAIYKIIRKELKVNGKRAKEDTVLELGDELTFYMPQERFDEMSKPVKKRKAKRQFHIAYEDDNVLIVEKPWGLLTHGDSHEKKNTLMNQVCGYLQEKGEYDPATERTFTPSPVNRLDRNTTGLVIFGKNAQALRLLTKLIRERDHISKYYITIVSGNFTKPITIQESLEKIGEKNTVHVVADGEGLSATTVVRPLEKGKGYSLIEVELVTGRTHQIRAHLSHKGYPLIGDSKYGDFRVNEKIKKFGLTTQLLHAYRLEFGQMPEELAELDGLVVKAQVPEEFEKIWAKLK